MWPAIVRIRHWPKEIEADLQREYGLDITDWHRDVPTLSSRKLLVLLDELGQDSSFRREHDREGNWPMWMQMLKHLTNETSLHRASQYAGGDNAYNPTVFMDPIEVQERIEEAMADKTFRERTSGKLYSQLGWT